MSAEIITFPRFFDCVARRVARVMGASSAGCEEGKFTEAMDDLGIGIDGGLELRNDQWRVVWDRVDELMPTSKRSRQGGR